MKRTGIRMGRKRILKGGRMDIKMVMLRGGIIMGRKGILKGGKTDVKSRTSMTKSWV